jgi:hypothetical protein
MRNASMCESHFDAFGPLANVVLWIPELFSTKECAQLTISSIVISKNPNLRASDALYLVVSSYASLTTYLSPHDYATPAELFSSIARCYTA